MMDYFEMYIYTAGALAIAVLTIEVRVGALTPAELPERLTSSISLDPGDSFMLDLNECLNILCHSRINPHTDALLPYSLNVYGVFI